MLISKGIDPMIKKGFILSIFGLFVIIPVFAQPHHNIVIDNDIQLIHLQDSIYVHVTWHQLDNFGRFPSNGLIVIKNAQALMVDTPMDNDKTGRLTKYLKDSMSVDLVKVIIGHFHDDCLGGLGYLQSIGIESIANSRTIAKCIEIGIPVPSTSFADSLTFDFNGEQIDCRFFGAGHSFDNITVWIPDKRILFGGCLIKSANLTGLGNLSDAVIADWDYTIEKIMKNYPLIQTVIPGHGQFGGAELLKHTVELVENEKNR
jgi:metallo-beta-lactamase class B